MTDTWVHCSGPRSMPGCESKRLASTLEHSTWTCKPCRDGVKVKQKRKALKSPQTV